jgi:DNA processing protein
MVDLDTIRRARIYLTRVAEPPAPALTWFVAQLGPVTAAERVRARTVPDDVAAETKDRHHWADARDADFGDPDRGLHLLIPEDAGTWPAAAMDALLRPAPDRPLMGAPFALWARTGLDPAAVPSLLEGGVALLGARAASSYGETVAAEFGYELAYRGITVSSGASYGIEGAGLRGALAHSRGGGRTVAVLACGIDQDYPRDNSSLLANVAAEGVILSEYPPGVPPARCRFLARQRLLAAISSVVVIVEAGARSGSRAAATTARLLDRTVMAVPGPITSALSRTTNQLLHDREALAATSVEDVLEAHRQSAAATSPEIQTPATSE